MILFSNAKINIGLNVNFKRDDGFHNIESIFYPIPFYDILEIKKSKTFKFSNSGIKINEHSNLVLDAYQLLNDRFNLEPISIHLHKQIPLGSGLGGGSSNATNTLIGLSHIFDLQLNTDDLTTYALALGSDCPFFIRNQPMHVTGRGDILSSTDLSLAGNYVKIVNTGLHISTQEAFFGLTPQAKPFEDNWQLLTNDFERTIFQGHPELSVIKAKLLAEGAIYASMTGTGSTIYGIFETKPELSGEYRLEKIFQLA